MIILALDSTAKAASVAVFDDEKMLASYSIDNGLTHSELLLPMAEMVLKTLKLSFNDINLYATSTGPGSFTGVRIGASLVKGLAFGKDIPCISVSTIEALAENLAGLDGIVVPCMDARRGQVYTALFSSDANGQKRLCEDKAIALTELAEELKKYADKSIYLCGDGYFQAKEVIEQAGVAVCNTPPMLLSENAFSVARVALRKYRSGEYITDRELSPTYLRVPQAERERLERLKKEEQSK